MMRSLILALLLLPSFAFAKVELFQIVVFDWDERDNKLKLVSMGSGTAIDSDVILTNKHVVQTGVSEFADLLVLCQASQRAGESVSCDTVAGVSAAHPEEDIAIVRPIDKAFFPKVRLSHRTKRAGDPVRVFGFPVPNSDKIGFGDNRTLQAFTNWLDDPQGPLEVTNGDKLTVTRGQVEARLINNTTGFTYTLTDAKVDFGNSGGAVFDEYGDYLGVITYKDPEGNAIFLEYHQIDEWVKNYSHRRPNYETAAYDFHQALVNGEPIVQTRKLSPIQERLRQLRARKSGVIDASETTTKNTSHLSTSKQRLLDHLRSRYQSRR